MTHKYLKIPFTKQLKAVLPSIFYTILMIIMISICLEIFESKLLQLIIGFIIGVFVYFFISAITKNPTFFACCLKISSIIKRNKK